MVPLHVPVPGQVALPGALELLVVVLLFLLTFALAFALAYYVYNDAEERGEDNAALWAVVAGLATIVASPVAGVLVFAVYVWQRPEKPQ